MRPVGEPVPLRRRSFVAGPNPWPAGFRAFFVESGTAALGLALQHLRERSGLATGSVILPGYGCPDLVSAAEYAGLEAVLCDLALESPFLDQGDLQRKLSPDVVAVVATHFLGLGEDTAGIGSICGRSGVSFVEDSAQRLPESDTDPGVDAIIYSFGRGKPVSGFGGGAMLLRELVTATLKIEHRQRTMSATIIPAAMPLMILARNWCLTDFGYRMIRAIPAAGVGQVVFKPLDHVQALAEWRRHLAEELLPIRMRAAAQIQARAVRLSDMLKRFSGQILDIPVRLGQQNSATLLRYPVLLPEQTLRDKVLAALDQAGLGASAFYGKTLADLPGMPPVSGAVPEARRFASRLVTLPVHSGVTDRSIAEIESVLSTLLG